MEFENGKVFVFWVLYKNVNKKMLFLTEIFFISYLVYRTVHMNKFDIKNDRYKNCTSELIITRYKIKE